MILRFDDEDNELVELIQVYLDIKSSRMVKPYDSEPLVLRRHEKRPFGTTNLMPNVHAKKNFRWIQKAMGSLTYDARNRTLKP
jgi:hypothetical protein